MNVFSASSADVAPWVLLIFAISATYLWRGMGTAIAARIDPDSDLLTWIACIAYGLLAGLISRILFLPVGLLAETERVDRLGATVFGFLLFIIFKRNIAVGTLSAAGLFMLLVWLRSEGIL